MSAAVIDSSFTDSTTRCFGSPASAAAPPGSGVCWAQSRGAAQAHTASANTPRSNAKRQCIRLAPIRPAGLFLLLWLCFFLWKCDGARNHMPVDVQVQSNVSRGGLDDQDRKSTRLNS